MRRGLAVLVLFAAGSAAAATPAEPPTVLLVGDSTMAPKTGYGDALCQRLKPAVACLNLARGGRSTLSYRAEGLWDRALARLQAGEPSVPRYLLIQFGHNDQPGKPGRSTDLSTEFPANLARYVTEVRAAGGTPVLLTPLTRRSFRGSALNNDLQPWAEAVRVVARAQGVPLVDLNAHSAAMVQAMGREEADRLAQAPPGAEGFDRTHLGERGACVFADLVVRELRLQIDLPAAANSPPAPDCAALPAPRLAPSRPT